MPFVTPRRLASAVSIPALALGLAACSTDSDGESNEDDTASLSPEQAVLASYDNLEAESFTMQTSMTVDGINFLEMTMMVEGDSSRTSQNMFMSAILEASGEDFSDEDYADDPEFAEMMEAMLGDIHIESIIIDDVAYMQVSGGMFGAASEEYGEDAWFVADLAEYGDLSELQEQIGSLDLGSQTELLLTAITDVEETSDGVYTGTLSGDSEIMQDMLHTTGTGGAPQGELDAAEVTVTVDGDGLLETMEVTFPEIEGMTMHMVSEVVEIGGSYDITAPESDNLHPFEELTGPLQ